MKNTDKSSKVKNAILEANKLEPPYSPDNLKKIRASFGLNQSEFARFLGVERTWVTKREQGVNRMSSSDNAYIELLLFVRGHEPKLIAEKMLNC